MSESRYVDNVLTERWDDVARTYTDFRTDPDTTRPYTPDENTLADALAGLAQADANRATIETALGDALATLQVIIDDSNTNINGNPAARIKDLARTQRRAIRLLIRRLDGTS